MGPIPPIVAFAAPSGTGKTTLIEGVVRALVARGLKLAVLKSDAHRVVLDKPGKDSWRFAEAGAQAVAVLSQERAALFERLDGEVSLVGAVARFFPDADLVLAEGFRSSDLPSIRVHRRGGPGTEGWVPPRRVIAWASDEALPIDLPLLPLDRPEQVADWLVARFLAPRPARSLTLACATAGAAGRAGALETAGRLGALLGVPAMLICGDALAPPGGSAPTLSNAPGLCLLQDLRPGLGLLGALFTALAAAPTPYVLLVGPRHAAVPEAALRALITGGSPQADIVFARQGGLPDPALALYGHRCLSAIQSALLSGEVRMTGWWGQVRACGVELPG